MSSLPSNEPLSWPARALIGGLMGGVLGVVELFDGFSVVKLGSAVVAGAIFYSVIGVFGARSRIRAVFLCAVAGGLAGGGWAVSRSSSIPAAVLLGTLLGAAVGFFELGSGGASRDAA